MSSCFLIFAWVAFMFTGCAHSPHAVALADGIVGAVRSDIKDGKYQFLCSSAGTLDDMHVPGLSQEEVDAVMRDYEVTLTWYVYDGHEFVIRPEGGIDTSEMERKYSHAEQYNRCLYDLLMKSDSFPKKKRALK